MGGVEVRWTENELCERLSVDIGNVQGKQTISSSCQLNRGGRQCQIVRKQQRLDLDKSIADLRRLCVVPSRMQ